MTAEPRIDREIDGARNFDARVELQIGRAPSQPTGRQLGAAATLSAGVESLAVDYDRNTGATRSVYNRLGYLTEAVREPIDGDPVAIARRFARDHVDLLGLDPADLDGAELTDAVHSRLTGVTHVYLRQVLDGLPVYNGQLHVNVGRDGRILSVNNLFLPALRSSVSGRVASLSAASAVTAAAVQIGLEPSRPPRQRAAETAGSAVIVDAPGISRQEVVAELMWLPVAVGDARLVWRFQLDLTDREPHYFDFTVDAASGRVWTRFDWVSEAQYRVYPTPNESPVHTTPLPPADARVVVVDPSDPLASPSGWQGENTTLRGNNVHAYIDPDDDDQPPVVEPDCGESQNCDFDYPIDFATQAPDTFVAASVTNLFYWTNLSHDIHYYYGFDEVAGNFQNDNFGRGGTPGDRIDAQSQNGNLTCNANFLTLPDGVRGRLQMFNCGNDVPRDGSFDNGVVLHEFGHGVSKRLVGGPSQVSCLGNAQQPDEGLSDWWTLALTAQASHDGTEARGIGNYLIGEGATGPGLRPQPYSTDPSVNDQTYSSIDGLVVPHGVGSVFAQAYWEVYWALVDQHGFDADLIAPDFASGNQRAILYLSEGLKNTICAPTFTDVRDGIIQAAISSGLGDECLLWRTFAGFGLGVNALSGGPGSTTPQDGFDTLQGCPFVDLVQVQTFDTCDVRTSNENGIWEPGEVIEVRVDLVSSEFLSGVAGTLSVNHPDIVVLDGSASWPNLHAGATATTLSPHFSLLVADNATCLDDVTLVLDIVASTGGPYHIEIAQTIGRAVAPSDVPVAIIDSATITSTIPIARDRAVANVAVTVDIDHAWVGDLTLTLESPSGTEVVLLARPGTQGGHVGCGDQDMTVTFVDGAGGDLQNHCAGTSPWFSGSASPLEPLSMLSSESAAGVWKLHVNDAVAIDEGMLVDWGLLFSPELAVECRLCEPAVLTTQGDLVIDFGTSYGVWALYGGTTWANLHGQSARHVATGDIDGGERGDVVVDFGGGGIWALLNGAGWVLLHGGASEGMAIGRLDAGGRDDMIVDFGAAYGLYLLRDGVTWEGLHPFSADSITMGDVDGDGLDEALIDFGAPYGIYELDSGVWSQLHPFDPDSVTTGDLDGNGADEVIVDFGAAYGIWVLYNHATWVSLHPLSPVRITTGDLDGSGRDELIVDFGATYGIWALYDSASWAPLHPFATESMVTADLDANGLDELIIDFGPAYGIWVLNDDATWQSLHPFDPDSITPGDVDGI